MSFSEVESDRQDEERIQREGRVMELEARIAQLEAREVNDAAPTEPGELTDEKIASFFDEAYENFDRSEAWRYAVYGPRIALRGAEISVVRRCLAIDRASRPAPKWVAIQSRECDGLLDAGWKFVQETARWSGAVNGTTVLMCPPVQPPTEEK